MKSKKNIYKNFLKSVAIVWLTIRNLGIAQAVEEIESGKNQHTKSSAVKGIKDRLDKFGNRSIKISQHYSESKSDLLNALFKISLS